MEEEINSLKNSNNLYENAKQELEDLLQSVENGKREAEEENMKSKGEVSKLRKDLASRME
jgi:hypothetical protein